jgi:hypothetical protein
MMEVPMTVPAAPAEFVRPTGRKARPQGAAVTQKAGILRRLFDALVRSRVRHANQDIARHFHLTGGHLTDEMEREMMEQLTRNWSFRP